MRGKVLKSDVDIMIHDAYYRSTNLLSGIDYIGLCLITKQPFSHPMTSARKASIFLLITSYLTVGYTPERNADRPYNFTIDEKRSAK